MTSFPESTKRWARHMREHIGYAIYFGDHLQELERAQERVQRSGRSGGEIAIPTLEELLRFGDVRQLPETVFNDKRRLVKEIHGQMSYNYGFGECLVTGDWAPLPPNLTQVTCASQALVNLLITNACDMESVLVELEDIQDGVHTFPSHAMDIVEVGDETPWAIDQPRRAYGPIFFEKNSFRIINRANQNKVRKLTFRSAEWYDEARYVERLEYQRSREGAASLLLHGQRIKSVKADHWKAKEPLFSEWYIRYNHDRIGIPRSVSVTLQFDRPFILQRGIEHRIILGDDGRPADEQLIGYLCKDFIWEEPVSPIPVMVLSPKQVPQLLEGLYGLSVDEQNAFEEGLMRLFSHSDPVPRYERYQEAILSSYRALQATQWGRAVRKMSLAEALYQHERNSDRYVYGEKLRQKVFERFSVGDPDLVQAVRAPLDIAWHERRQPRRLAESLRGRTFAQGPKPIRILQRDLVDDAEVMEFHAIEDTLERLRYIDSRKPEFIQEAADRVLFAERALNSHLGSLEALEAHAHSSLGGDLEPWIMSGYARLFAEMLGHTAGAWEYVNLPSAVRADVLRKVRAYKP